MPKHLLYKLLYAVLFAVALLPMRVLYVLADGLELLMYHVVRYRRHVVRDNIARALPQLTEAEQRRVERQFYSQFADYIVETVKLIHMPRRVIERRLQVEGIEHIERAMTQGRSVTAYFSHYGNWEWVASLPLHSRLERDPKARFGQVYRPLKNQWFDSLMLRLRNQWGGLTIPKTQVLRRLLTLRKEGVATTIGFMSDQKPSHNDHTVILRFLGQPTAMIAGTEHLARKLDTAVVYFDLSKPRRGHYLLRIVPMADSAATTAPNQLTVQYARLLEQTIHRQPALWLWSHKRWKNPVTL